LTQAILFIESNHFIYCESFIDSKSFYLLIRVILFID